ncbi:acyltransferase [Ciceribacter sp. L1K22]|uniref:acyltransferase n=1 Tax=Ciceribacter sp. L1K22 TaxID=2820275 RepID=UPI001ABDB9CF|nr:acyltransferase [Ciceribacter sp. L1K22]MBO3758410.1 acyltransferase [Ciceribacter sp. L1K22]
MLSRYVEIRTTDAHSVIDRKTGERLNLAGPVTIGDHVWIGMGAIISKGVTIGDDNIVGARSFVTKSFVGSGTIIAGAPAKVIKSGVTWSRLLRKRYSEAEMEAWRQ